MDQTTNKRRNFILALGLGSIGAAATVLTGKKPAPQAEEPHVAEAPVQNKGYQLSEHVKTYYSKARI